MVSAYRVEARPLTVWPVLCALCVSQLSESPACPPPCHPAETAEINQYDLADALIDTERSQREEGPESGNAA